MSEPWIRFEDEHLLVVPKPAGVRSERADRFGQQGVVEWVRSRRPDERLEVVHADPDDVAGVVVFGRTPESPRLFEASRHRFSVSEPPVVDGPLAAAAAADAARRALLDVGTDAYVMIDRHHDGFPGVRVERLGSVAMAYDFREPATSLPTTWIDAWLAVGGIDSVYRQHRPRRGEAPPTERVAGDAPPRFDVHEFGHTFRIDLEASPTSTGLFLDQRETRWRLGAVDRTDATVLNVFAHTGSLSVAAATAGAETLTQDLSKEYLDWARANLVANDLDPDDHDFVYGDALDWMSRFAKRGRRFDVVLVDPPSSSTNRKGKRWSVARDLHDLVALGARLVTPGGELFVSTNMAKLSWPKFLDHVDRGLRTAARTASIEPRTLPLDHRSSADDPPYLKAAWMELDR